MSKRSLHQLQTRKQLELWGVLGYPGVVSHLRGNRQVI